MIAARQIAFGGSAKKWENPYITDGLVAMWDGEWNAGGGKHDANATVWKDLVGDDDLVCSGDYVWNNGFEYPSTMQGVTKAVGNTLYTLGDLSIHICVSIKSSTPSNIHSGDLFSLDRVAGSGIVSYAASKNQPQTFSWWTFGANHASTVVAIDGETTSAVLAKEGSVINAFLDGRRVEYWRQTNTLEGFVSIGQLRDQSKRSAPNAIVHNFGIYNRALTAEEIAYNYNIDKQRFGL